MRKKFEEFIKSDFGLEIRNEGEVIFNSKKSGIQGLLEFIKNDIKPVNDLIIFDKKVGNAVALLCVYLKTKEVYGLIGSETAKETLEKSDIKFYFSKIIPNILNKEETDICPMEKKSLNKTSEEFLELLKKENIF